MKVLSVVVPVYCDADTLPPLNEEFGRVEEELGAMGVRLELIFVDDGSTDDTLLRLLDIKQERPDAKVVKLTRNFGAVCAVKAGFRFVNGDCFLAIAADLQDPVDTIPELVRHWQRGAKYVILVRQTRDDALVPKLFSRFFYSLVRLLIFRKYPDGGFDVALMDKALLPYMRDSGKNLNPSLYSYYLGYQPTIVHYHRRKRVHGKSKWGFVKKLNYFANSLLGFSITPLRVVAAIGLFVALGSFAYGLFVIVITLVEGSPVPGFPSLAALISFLCGATLFTTGLIGEYVWRIFDEINKRPESVIDEVF